jgi:hypothetical protein
MSWNYTTNSTNSWEEHSDWRCGICYVIDLCQSRKFYLSHKFGHGDWYLPSFFCTDSETNNNAAMSLTSIQKNINFSPQTWTYVRSHIQVGYSSLGFAYWTCSSTNLGREALTGINKMVTSISHVFPVKRSKHTA